MPLIPQIIAGAKQVTGAINNPIGTMFPGKPVATMANNVKNVGEQVLSTKPFSIANTASDVVKFGVPTAVSTVSSIGAGINTLDQVLEILRDGLNPTLNNMQKTLQTKHFKNPIIDTGNDIFQAGGRPLISGALGIRQGVRALKPALRYRPHPEWKPAAPAHGAQMLMKQSEDKKWWYDMRTQMQKGKYEGHIPHEKFKAENPEWVMKQADWTDWDLQRHQQRVAKRMADKKTEGLVVAHGMGSGKTLSSLATYKKLKMPTTVVPPAALIGNYQKEIGKWMGKQPQDLQIESQQRAALKGLQHDPKNGLLIVDEAHRARENESKLLAALNQSEAKKRMLLTGTPIVNHPRDLSTLVNFVANRKVLPDTPGEFNKQYFQPDEVKPSFLQGLFGVKPGIQYKLKNPAKLRKILDKYVDYYPGSQVGYPSVKQEEVKVPMGNKQMNIYKTIMGQAPWWVRWKVKSGLPPGKGELETMRAFLSGVRQVSNTSAGFTTRRSDVEGPKIDKAFSYLQNQLKQDPSYKAVVYSNYLGSGLNPYKQQLEKNKIPYGEFSGVVNPAVRNQLVRNYNANKIKALLISSAGAEGLDLKGTRLIQLLEPHFNEEKEKQIIGRGVRFHSHDKLPPYKQNVLVQRYLAQPHASWLDRLLGHPEVRGADEYIRQIAMQKDQLNRQVMGLMNPEEKKRSIFQWQSPT